MHTVICLWWKRDLFIYVSIQVYI